MSINSRFTVTVHILALLALEQKPLSSKYIAASVNTNPVVIRRILGLLSRAGLVTTRKEGAAVHYSLTSPHVAELLVAARRILSGVLSGQVELLEDLRATSPPVPRTG